LLTASGLAAAHLWRQRYCTIRSFCRRIGGSLLRPSTPRPARPRTAERQPSGAESPVSCELATPFAMLPRLPQAKADLKSKPG
jgi:hypothetical protein